MTYHPWRALRQLPELRVEWRSDMPPGLLAVLDGSTIWMATSQTQAERRSTLTHELIHHERGDGVWCSARDEQYARREAACRLIALHELAAALAWSLDPHQAADELWVDLDTFLTRMEHLMPAELALLRTATAHHEVT